MERAYVADKLIGASQKIPGLQVRNTFLGKIKTAVRLGSKSWFNDIDLAQVTSIWACFLFFKYTYELDKMQ